MKNKFTVDYFINKFSKIPDKKWITGVWSNNGKCCVLGHCGERNDGTLSKTRESEALRSLTYEYLWVAPYSINDGFDELKMLGDTPKERVLTALELIKAGVSV